MKNFKPYQLILILTPFVFSFAFGLDIYIPILPQMMEIFDTSVDIIQLTMSLFLFTAGVGQLLMGPLADQFGRKPIFYFSAACFAFGGVLCAFSPHVSWLIAARILSAIGACGMLVTSFAVVRDLYTGNESAQIYSYLNGAIGISPTFAPVLGGYLAYYFGWHSVFFFLAFIGIMSLFITKSFITETQKKEGRIPIDIQVIKRYGLVYKNRQFLVYATLAGLAETVFFCFFSTSPIIIINLSGIPSYQFGYYFAIFGSVIGLAGLASGKIVEKIGPETTISFGISLMLLGGLSMMAWHNLTGLSLTGYLLPMVIACTGAMFMIGASAARALEPFGEIAGTASAAFGSFDLGVSAIGGAILMFFPINSAVPYAIAILIATVLSAIFFYLRPQELKGLSSLVK